MLKETNVIAREAVVDLEIWERLGLDYMSNFFLSLKSNDKWSDKLTL